MLMQEPLPVTEMPAMKSQAAVAATVASDTAAWCGQSQLNDCWNDFVYRIVPSYEALKSRNGVQLVPLVDREERSGGRV
jgi:hypothetical protein